MTAQAFSEALRATRKMRPADVEMCCARIRAQGTGTKAARELGTRLADYDVFMLRGGRSGWPGCRRRLMLATRRPKRAEREGGSILLSKATMRHVAETATDGQFAFFEDALAREYALRHQSRIARLKRQANFPSQKGFDGFEWSGIVFPRGFTRDDMLSLAFIDAHEDLVLFGGSGNGKTHTAIALGLLACGEGRKVAFWSTAELVSELRRANKEGTTQDALRRLDRCDLIILDEWGYLPTDPDGARLLFRVVSMCYERIRAHSHHQHRILQMG